MRVLRVVALVAVVAVGAAACSEDGTSTLPKPNKAFCQAAYDFDTNAPSLVGKIDRQIALVRTMAANAPADVKSDADTFLAAMVERKAGDTSVVDNPKIKKAVDNVERRANNGCGLFNQDPPSGM